ncbi:MAG: bifunctional [glutamate--ammonia ligase]-adenylyl-L-tyrosine phosphorylase/[glutamate--ammonia-ligase] adenylyltransferase, partial [bacterium]|nr:bifunctional [glutamate--ammonia ligase]-adenylyl-L-tyrosine phosphorylase/[glutamate--ammonia-ligase] adenylyltransferase [bacterium]
MSLEQVIPEILAARMLAIAKQFAAVVHPLKEAAELLLLRSDYALRHIKLLEGILTGEMSPALLCREDYFSAINRINLDSSPTDFSSQLRLVRHTHFLRLLLLETAQIATIEEVMRSWSDCADALILHALSYCQRHQSVRYGIPVDEKGQKVELFTLAMGKLGGRELNYSSDIDLIFIYSARGITGGAESISNEQYFSKSVQQFVQLMQHITAEGFVFRVDLRLRPNGESGALVSSLAAIETYYQEQGRDWERYAMVKARVINEVVDEDPSWFQEIMVPFTYRSYVDFSVLESLRSMKLMIEQEIVLNPRLNDMKRGRGGIREIEFIIQNIQLIRGGRIPQLQQQNAMQALRVLKQEQLLHHSLALQSAYFYLRKLENAVQSLNDQQTHSLPEDELQRAQIALAMGCFDWHNLMKQFSQYQRIVSRFFHAILAMAQPCHDEKQLLVNQLGSLWQGHIEANMATNLLTSLGYTNSAYCYRMIHAFKHGPRCRRLSQAARMRLDRFMVILLTELNHTPKTDELLVHVMSLLDNIVGRSAYLALLTENPQALKELLYWFAHSPFITSLLVKHPFLLEVLLDQEQNWQPAAKAQLTARLSAQLSHIKESEMQQDVLR